MSEFESPFILKISFNAPTTRGTANSAAHVKYIGTRPGVAFEKDMEFNEIENIEDVIKLSEAKGDNETTSEDYAKYIGNRPGSHGLFSQFEDEAINLDELQFELKNHQGPVWKMILSLKEDDALKLGYTNRGTWEDMLRRTVPDVANKMGISQSDMKWVAAFHEEKGHPHVHLMLWEKEMKRDRGVLSKGERMDVRRTFVNEIYEPHRVQLYQEKTAERDIIRDLVKDDISERTRILKGIESEIPNVKNELKAVGSIENNISPKITDSLSGLITEELVLLSELMPDKGRIAFKFMPEVVKEESLRIADKILQSPELHKHVNNYLKHTEELTRHHALNPDVILKARDNAYEDLKKRVAQIVLKGAAESKRISFMEVDFKKIDRVIKDFSHPIKKPEQDLYNDVLTKVAIDFENNGFSIKDTKEVFEKWSGHANLSKTQSDLNNLIDKAYSLPNEQTTEGLNNLVNILKISGYEKNEIFNKTPELSSLENQDSLYKDSEKFQQKINVLHISTREWSSLEKSLKFKSDYPYDLKERTELKGERADFKKLLVESKLEKNNESLEEYNSRGGWSAYCMNVALNQSGFNKEERSEIVNSWLRANGVDADFEKMNASIKDGTNFLRKPTWDKLVDNLQIEVKDYPWETYQEWEFNPDKGKKALDVIEKNLDNFNPEYKDTLIKTVTKLHKNISENNQEFEVSLKEWNGKLPSELTLNETELKDVVDLYAKRTKDLDVLSKTYGVKDIVEKTTFDYAKLLYSLNVSDQDVKQIINDWNSRTKLGYSEEKLETIIDKAKFQHQENTIWGKTTFLSKDDFNSLSENLGVKSLYPYKHVNSPGLSSNLFKTLWKSIEKADKQNEAQVKMIQKRIRRQHAIEHGKIKEFMQEEELER